ncbi:phosphoglycerate mutase family protein [Ruegeria lacuscaerulensis ITI-1157]|nr:phosphoglycerate mutase family protein [Ruegeria lacuscaerulensis ITI-1157]SHK03549.1 phosphohistidine phosphatase [Ruegeria lacuscaerulensis ITI-1157]
MTRTLILTRHAKSSWDHPGLPDHDRPLNKRGRASASAIGDWLRRKGYKPDEVLSSSSERTRETWLRMGLSARNIRFLPELYHAAPEQMRQALSQATGRTVLMLGHNPGIAEFAERCAQSVPKHPRFLDYPTCATTVLVFEMPDWSGIGSHRGQVIEFVTPRELTK